MFRSKVSLQDRVPIGQKIAYGLGGPVEGAAIWIPSTYLTPVFNIGLGLNPGLLGLIVMIWRAWDAITDPVVGNISDNARTRWGRRRPFIVVGAVLTGVLLPVMWWAPRGMPEGMTFVWLLVAGLLFYTCFTLWSMPYYSLQLEMTPDYDERTSITSYRAFPQKILLLLNGWILAFVSMPVWGINADGTPDIVNGMRYLSLILATCTILLGVLPGIFVKERYYAKESSKQEKQKLISGLKITLTTRPFILVLIIVITKTFGIGLVGTLGFYVNAYYVCEGNVKLAAMIMGVSGTLMFAPNLIAIPVCTWIATRYGKRFMLYLTAITGLVGYLSVYIFYTPSNPWLQIIPSILIGPLGIGLWLIVPAMQADVADYDELITGKRREGSFSAVFSLTTKVSSALCSGLGGVVLVWTGFDVELGMSQPDHVLVTMLNLYVIIPVVFLVLNIICIGYYTLTREKMAEIRQELEQRRGVI
ncbi:MFS transporter [Ruficoccus amylovorans]|uniref:MFS transporter n=1 Tax=Ruficoccus amylovorans TaxID=1804625 RepID=A0A842HBL4_9BACT|nr:MFS transporter [Ruficoccus amylovorans]